MKITTLVENLVYVPNLKAEHGLSFLIETNDVKFLFDTGQTDVLVHNAERKKIDLSQIDFVVLSHGHYDHSGGLDAFFEINQHAQVYLKPDTLQLKYSGDGRKIGMKRELRARTNRFQCVTTETEIAPSIFLMPQIPIVYQIDTHFERMKTEVNSQRIADEFSDELFLVIRQAESLVVISSCSHRGISNMCEYAKQYFKLPISMVLGGFHTRNATPEQYLHLVSYFEANSIKNIGTCHCTGIDGFLQLKQSLGNTVFYNYVGNCIEI